MQLIEGDQTLKVIMFMNRGKLFGIKDIFFKKNYSK